MLKLVRKNNRWVLIMGWAILLGGPLSAYASMVAQEVAPEVPERKEPIILVYHSVEPKTDKPETAMQKQYHVYPEVFRAQMEYLKNNGYAPIPMKVYLDYLNRGIEIPPKSVVITFDDGWKNQMMYAVPILKEFGYTATFYIVTGSVGVRAYVTWDEIEELKKLGMDIQSHTHSHAHLTKIPEEKALEELRRSKKILEEKIQRPVRMIAYPYYQYNPRVQELVREAGYTAARAGWRKEKNSKETLLVLKSQEVVNAKNPFSTKADSY